MEIKDIVNFSSKFEDYLEVERPVITFEQRAEISGLLLDFLKSIEN